MNTPRKRSPGSPLSEALNSDPRENAREAERLYDSPDRHDVTKANQEAGDKGRPDAGDPVIDVNVRKPV